MMKSVNITKSYLSVSSPGTYLMTGDTAAARKLTRLVNDYGGKLKKDHPDQFGFFASLAQKDVEGSLDEIAHGFDTLDADGVTVHTNHHGRYLGHKDFDSIFDELNKRRAVVFIQPTTPCMHNVEHATPLDSYPKPMFEFLFDTARAVINVFLSGTVKRCPDITWLIPHCGGTLPPLINRFSAMAAAGQPGSGITPAWVREQLNTRFYFDTAGFSYPEQIKGLLEYVCVDRVLYGSDFPFTGLKYVQALSDQHEQHLPTVFPKKEDQKKASHGNALELFSKLRRAG